MPVWRRFFLPVLRDLIMSRRRVVIQRNPISGSGRGAAELLQLCRELRRLGYRVRMFSRRHVLDQWLRQPQNMAELHCCVAAGGDGTVADLVNRHPGVPLAVLPLGTENLLAKYIGIRCCGRTLAEIVDQNRIRVMDSVLADSRRFLLMLSVGPDADVVKAVHASRRGRIFRSRYVWPVIRTLLFGQVRQYRVRCEESGESWSGSHIILTNVPRYGFGMPFSPLALPDDGLLDVRVVQGTTRWGLLWQALRLKLGLPVDQAEYARVAARSVRVELLTAEPGVQCQCDGDPGPELPVVVQIDRASVCLLVPDVQA